MFIEYEFGASHRRKRANFNLKMIMDYSWLFRLNDGEMAPQQHVISFLGLVKLTPLRL
jgi:hypothetical protein